jgi:hypothetical protein
MTPAHRVTPLRLGLAAVAWLALAGADDPTRNATPPPVPRFAPPADTLFADDFSRGLARWRPDDPSVWSAWRGMLRADMPDARQQRSFIYTGSEEWTDYAVELDVCMMRGVDKGVIVRVEGESGIGVDLRGQAYQDVLLHRREWPLGKASVTNPNGVWHRLRVEAQGHRYRVFVNGEMVLDKRDKAEARPSGRIALPAYTGGVGQCTVYYDNVIVTPLPPAGVGAVGAASKGR